MNYQNWTKEEDELLIRLSKNYFLIDICKKMNRSKSSIVGRAYKILKIQFKSNQNKWLKKDDKLLINLAKKFLPCDISKKMGRTILSIKNRGRRLKLKFLSEKSPKWTVREDNIIKKFATTHSIKEIAKMLNRSKEAIQIRGSRILKISFHPTKWSDSDIQLLLMNYSKLSSTELVDLLKRPYDTIKSKAQTLNLISKYHAEQIYFSKNKFFIKIKPYKITSHKMYDKLYDNGKLPKGCPPNPDYTYKIKWHEITSNRGKNIFLSFDKAHRFAMSLGITKMNEWNKLCQDGKIPSNIPFAPHTKYKNDGWISWYHFLTGLNNTWLPFEEMREFMRSLRLGSQKEWFKWWDKNKPHNIPRHPDRVYRSHE